jgi:hypothetical protein
MRRDEEIVARAIHCAAQTHCWDFEDCVLCPELAREVIDELNRPAAALDDSRERDRRIEAGL